MPMMFCILTRLTLRRSSYPMALDDENISARSSPRNAKSKVIRTVVADAGSTAGMTI